MKRVGIGIIGALLLGGGAVAQPAEETGTAALGPQAAVLAEGCCADVPSLDHYLLEVTALPWQQTPASALNTYGSDNRYSRALVAGLLADDLVYRAEAGSDLTAGQRKAQHDLLRLALAHLTAGRAVDSVVARFANRLELAAADDVQDFGARLSVYVSHTRQLGTDEQGLWLEALFDESEQVRVNAMASAFWNDTPEGE